MNPLNAELPTGDDSGMLLPTGDHDMQSLVLSTFDEKAIFCKQYCFFGKTDMLLWLLFFIFSTFQKGEVTTHANESTQNAPFNVFVRT